MPDLPSGNGPEGCIELVGRLVARQLIGDGTALPAAAVLTVTGIALVANPYHHGQIGTSGPTVFEQGHRHSGSAGKARAAAPWRRSGRARQGLRAGPQQYRISARPKPLL